MKILVVTPYYYPKIGGLEIYARQLSLALQNQEACDIVVVTSNHNGRGRVEERVDGMKVYRLGTWMKLSNTPVNLLWPFRVRRIIKRESPDVILAHTPVPSMSDAAALAAGNTPFVLVYHASTLLKGDAFLFNIVASIYGFYERITLRKASRIFAVSDYVKEQLGSRFAHKTSVVPNAVWQSQIVDRSQPTDTNFLFIGSLDRTHAWKGLDVTIEAMARFKKRHGNDFSFRIMGDGNDRARYERLVKEHGLEDNIVFLGAKTGKEKDDEFRRATALVMYPTTANDAFPTVMLEAWAWSLPVIAAAIGPIPSLIRDRVDGYLVKPKDVSSLAKTLSEVAGSSKKQRAAIAKAAATRVSNEYTWEKQAAVVASRLKELL